jgi:hypothetical protein
MMAVPVTLSITMVGFDAIPRAAGNQPRGDDLARKTPPVPLYQFNAAAANRGKVQVLS